MPVHTYTVEDVSGRDGWLLRLGRAGLPETAQATLHVYGYYGDEKRLLRGPVTVEGGEIRDKSGNVAAYSWIGGTWPGSVDDEGVRTPIPPGSIEAEVMFDQDVTCDVEFSAVDTEAVLSGNR